MGLPVSRTNNRQENRARKLPSFCTRSRLPAFFKTATNVHRHLVSWTPTAEHGMSKVCIDTCHHLLWRQDCNPRDQWVIVDIPGDDGCTARTRSPNDMSILRIRQRHRYGARHSPSPSHILSCSPVQPGTWWARKDLQPRTALHRPGRLEEALVAGEPRRREEHAGQQREQEEHHEGEHPEEPVFHWSSTAVVPPRVRNGTASSHLPPFPTLMMAPPLLGCHRPHGGLAVLK